MTGAVFVETLRRNWRGMFYWGLGMGALALLQVVIVPDVESLRQMAELMETLPPAFIQAFGGGDLEYMSTLEGYLGLQFFSVFAVIFAVYAAICGMSVTANDEDNGTLDMVLALPIPRWRLIVEKLAAFILLIVGAVGLTFFGLWLGLQLTPGLNANMTRLVEGSFNVLPSLLLVLTFTVFIAVVVRRKSAATAIVGAFVVGSYFIDTLGLAAGESSIANLRAMSFFRYYDSSEVLQNGLAWGNIGLLIGVALVLAVGALWAFQRRDIAV